jgi:hypothetical protein
VNGGSGRGPGAPRQAARGVLRRRARAAILEDVRALHRLWGAGALGGARMPEDVHPALRPDAEELARYFTFGMSLNYQRDSYALWRACTATFDDPETSWAFEPAAAASATLADLLDALARHRVALQPRRHPDIWRRNASAFVELCAGEVGVLFAANGFDVGRVRDFIAARRDRFPYLCGPKIANYWLYVMTRYMSWPLVNRAALSVAPDRHVIAASAFLGLTAADADADVVAAAWRALLGGTEFDPIEIHTPLWLWSRGGFSALVR